MNRHMILTSVLCLLLGALSLSGNACLIFVDPEWPAVCVDSVTWVNVCVHSMVDSIHSYACLMYIDTSRVYLDSRIQRTILESIFEDCDTVRFGWECDEHSLDSLCPGARTFVNRPGQLARIWLRGKQEGET